jgi:hypothetical protein
MGPNSLGHPSRYRPEQTFLAGLQRDTNNAAAVLQAKNTKIGYFSSAAYLPDTP